MTRVLQVFVTTLRRGLKFIALNYFLDTRQHHIYYIGMRSRTTIVGKNDNIPILAVIWNLTSYAMT